MIWVFSSFFASRHSETVVCICRREWHKKSIAMQNERQASWRSGKKTATNFADYRCSVRKIFTVNIHSLNGLSFLLFSFRFSHFFCSMHRWPVRFFGQANVIYHFCFSVASPIVPTINDTKYYAERSREQTKRKRKNQTERDARQCNELTSSSSFSSSASPSPSSWMAHAVSHSKFCIKP